MHRQVVLGSPGCGKTTTLLNILDAELASGTQPERIGFVSFTRKAAEEAAVRACDRFESAAQALPVVPDAALAVLPPARAQA